MAKSQQRRTLEDLFEATTRMYNRLNGFDPKDRMAAMEAIADVKGRLEFWHQQIESILRETSKPQRKDTNIA